MRSRLIGVISVLLLAVTLGAGGSATAASEDAGPLRHYVVGFHALPTGLTTADTFQGADVQRVDRVLDFARVATRTPADFLARTTRDGRVRYVEPDPVRKLIEYTPNDPFFSSQYGPQQVRAPEAWDTTLGDMDARVCIVDTGVRYTHEEIAGARWLGGFDYVNNDADPADDNGHGTHVAGTAAGWIDNAKGIAGIANVGIHGVKVLDAGGNGAWSWVASGIRWCADNGGPRVVISMSLGGGVGAQVLQDAVIYAQSKGALQVAAAGNSGPCSNCIGYPAKYPEVIAVTCTDSAENQCIFSSDGPESELAAPGQSILAPWHTGDTEYNTISGTSMSTPHVSGAAALVWSHVTGLTASDLRQRLRNNAEDLGPGGWDEQYGYGLVDAADTLNPPPPPPEERIYYEDFDDNVANGWTLGGLWRVSSLCPPSPPSAPNYLGYHRDGICDYNTGNRTQGNATFGVDLTGRTSATLDFMHRFEKENYSADARDRMRVMVSTNGGSSYTTLKEWNSRTADQLAWTAHTIDLTSYTGGPVKLRFNFDSVNNVANDFDGWFLDNVEVAAPSGDVNQPPIANAGPDQTVSDADNSGSEPVTLNGTGSSDPDGSIVSYEWREGGSLIATGPTPTVDFAVGSHTVTLTVTDDDTATDNDDVVITVTPAGGGEVLYFEDFDDNVANGWTLGGLWRVSSLCPPSPPSAPNYLGYHRDGICDYNTGNRTTGNATFGVDLTGRSSATLNFMHRFVKENYSADARDRMRVMVSTNGGSSYTTLKEWNSRNADQPSWEPYSIDLTSYAGTSIKLRFSFDSVKPDANNFEGWFLDNVEILGS